MISRISIGRILVIALLLVVAFQVLYPLGMLLFGSVRDVPPGMAGNFTFEGYIEAYGDPETYRVFWTTLWLSAVRAMVAVATAVFLAWAVTRSNIPLKRFFEWSILFLFFMPLLPKVLAWILLLQPKTGLANQFLRLILPFGDVGPLNCYSYGGIIFTSVLLWTPLLFVLLAPAFRAMDASLEEQSRMSGASLWATIWHIDAPLVKPALVAASALAFVKMLESFTIEIMLGVPAKIYVFATKIYDYVAFKEPPEYPPAMALAITLMAITFIIVVMQWKLLGQRQYTTVTGKGFRVCPVDLGRLKYVVFSGVLLFVIVGFYLPFAVLIWGSFMKLVGRFGPGMYTLSHYSQAFSQTELMRSLWNTIVMGVVSATIGMILCSLIAYVVVKTRLWERHPLDLIAWIPWAIPGIVMALGFLWAYIFLPLPFGITIYGTLTLLILAMIFKGFPLGTRTMTSTMIQLANELEESSRVHGASWAQTFRRIVLPLVSPGFLAGWLLLFTLAVKDVSTVILLYKPSSVVLSTQIFNWWAMGYLEEAIVLGVLQSALIAVTYLAATLVGRRLIAPTAA